MIPSESFIPILYGLLVFAVIAYGALFVLVRIGLKQRFPREWEHDRQLSRERWHRRRERLLSIFR